MDRLFARSSYHQDERHVNSVLADYGLHFGDRVAVDGKMIGGVRFPRIDAVEVEYVAPYEHRAPRIGVLLAIDFEDGSGVHRIFAVDRVERRQ